MDKLHGNISKATQSFSYKEYIDSLYSGFVRNDWGKLEENIYNAIEQYAGGHIGNIVSKGVVNLLRLGGKQPWAIAIKSLLIATGVVSVDNLDPVNSSIKAIRGLSNTVESIVFPIIDKIIMDDVEQKRSLFESMQALEKALQSPLAPVFLPSFLNTPSQELITQLLRSELERKFNYYLNNPTSAATSSDDGMKESKIIFLDENQKSLNGNRGNDFLFGSENDDIINGWLGDDYLYGAGGMILYLEMMETIFYSVKMEMIPYLAV